MGLVGLVMLAMVVSACSGDDGETSAPPDDTSATTATGGGGTDAGAATSTTPSPPAGESTVRTFTDPVTALVRTPLETLPDVATQVAFDTTVIDAGTGPVACIGGVAQSFPPQCSGLPVAGLDWTALTEPWQEEAGVRWADLRVVGSWDRDTGTVTVTEVPGPVQRPEPVRPGATDYTLPEACAGIADQATRDADAVLAWTFENPDRSGGMWLADGTIPVLQVAGDPGPVAADLQAALGVPVCVVAVDWTEAELIGLQQALGPLYDDQTVWVAGTDIVAGVIELTVPVVDGATLRRIADTVIEPDRVVVLAVAETLG